MTPEEQMALEYFYEEMDAYYCEKNKARFLIDTRIKSYL